MKRLVLGIMALGALVSCRGQTSRETPIFGIRNMYDQPRYDMQEESAFFADQRTMRPLVEGVVAHDQEIEPAIARGRLDDETGYVLETPKAVVDRKGGMQAMLERGKERYGIYCTPCHDATGSGEGLVKRRAVASGAAAFVPPTFHQDRIRRMPDGQLFATISNGKSNMPPYAMQIDVDDRWAIVAYIRALQVAHPQLSAAPVAPTAVPGGTTTPPPGGVPTEETAPVAPGADAAAETGAGAPSEATETKPTDAAAPAEPLDQEKKP